MGLPCEECLWVEGSPPRELTAPQLPTMVRGRVMVGGPWEAHGPSAASLMCTPTTTTSTQSSCFCWVCVGWRGARGGGVKSRARRACAQCKQPWWRSSSLHHNEQQPPHLDHVPQLLLAVGLAGGHHHQGRRRRGRARRRRREGRVLARRARRLGRPGARRRRRRGRRGRRRRRGCVLKHSGLVEHIWVAVDCTNGASARQERVSRVEVREGGRKGAGQQAEQHIEHKEALAKQSKHTYIVIA